MQRAVFDRSIVDGYRTSKTEGIAVTALGRKLFAGTGDGSIVLYDCKPDTVGSTRFTCSVVDSIRKPTKEKKPVADLMVVESWRALVGIVDGVVTAFDSQYSQSLGAVTEQKGSHCYSVNEQSRFLVLANKKKLFQYAWQAPGFVPIREYNLTDVPKSLLCVRNCVVIGYRKHYECLDLITGNATRILDVEREHKMLITEMVGNRFRPDALLLSLGLQGVVLEMDKVLAGTSFAFGSTSEERLEWAGLPVFCSVLLPFIVSGLADSVEIHDLGSLLPLQRITISALGQHEPSFCSSIVELSNNNTQQFGFVCNGEELSVLKMIPIAKQVEELSARGLHEDAISLHALCAADAPEYVRGVDINRIHVTCAVALQEKGDYDKAVKHYIDGNAEFVSVIRSFPELVPPSMHAAFNVQPSAQKKAPTSAAPLQRAATAVVHFCDYHRPKMIKRAQRAEHLKELGILDSSMNSLSSGTNSSALYYGTGLGGGSKAAAMPMHSASISTTAPSKEDDDDDYITDPEEELRRAQLLDTVLLFALVNCQPSRRNATVQLLSAHNYCQVETCSVLLASQGNPFTEALLWLYRSHNLHSRVLDALKEDKSVAVGGWSKDQFYTWSADYLRWLWYHEGDPQLPRMALAALKPLLEYDAELGLSVLLCRPAVSAASGGVNAHPSIASLNKASFGGKGLTVSEVLRFLASANPNPNAPVRKAVPFGSATGTAGGAAVSASFSKYSSLAGSAAVHAVVAATPLVSGHALGVVFLECIVNSGEAPANMHDEFVQLLVTGLKQLPAAAKESDPEVRALAANYHRKLQAFLLSSVDYHPNRVIKLLPRSYLRERALVKSRQGEHQSVLGCYVHQLHDLRLAEWYCDRIHTAFLMFTGRQNSTSSGHSSTNMPSSGLLGAIGNSNNTSSNNLHLQGGAHPTTAVPVRRDDGIISGLREAGDIYLVLFRVLLMGREEWEDEENRGGGADDLQSESNNGSVASGSFSSAADRDREKDREAADERGFEEPESEEADWTAEQGLEIVVSLAERYYDRVDAGQFLEQLPTDMPLASLLRYFKIVLEYGSAKKRNLQIIHQLLRVREVQIRTNNV